MKRYSTYFKGEEKSLFDATWQYMKDHCDVTPEGIFFVKFHIKSKEEFERKVRSRMKGLHRDVVSEEVATKRKLEAFARAEIGQRIKEVGELNRNRVRKVSLWGKIKRYLTNSAI